MCEQICRPHDVRSSRTTRLSRYVRLLCEPTFTYDVHVVMRIKVDSDVALTSTNVWNWIKRCITLANIIVFL